jgi:hypothetical protein
MVEPLLLLSVDMASVSGGRDRAAMAVQKKLLKLASLEQSADTDRVDFRKSICKHLEANHRYRANPSWPCNYMLVTHQG